MRPIPLYFGSADEPIFGWFHDVAVPDRGLAAILCSPFGREELSAHRTLRTLAERLAQDGTPTLRFDYVGCGDSAADEGAAALVDRWIASVHAAIDEVKRLTGVSTVAIVGLRLGASLGAEAALSRSDVTAFVAIEAVVTGKGFVRELKMMQRGRAGAKSEGAGEVLESGGFFLGAATCASLTALDLRAHARPPASQVLLVNRSDMPPNDRWSGQLGQQGANVEALQLPGYIEMMLDPQHSRVPMAIVDAVVGWLSSVAPASMPLDRPRQEPVREARFGEVVERPVSFEAGGTRLHGVLSLSAKYATPQDAILILNAGATRRIGPSRMHVALARNLANRGCAVMRFDLSGLGDSDTCAGTESNIVYSVTAVAEVTLAAEYLLEKVDATRCHAVGLCAGAYHGLKAAARGAPLHGVVAINPLVFFWHDGMSIDTPGTDLEVAGDMAHYKSEMLSLQRWGKLVRGQIDLARFFGVLGRSMAVQTRHALRDMARWFRLPLQDDLARELLTLTDRRISLRFVFSENDPGHELLRTQGGLSLTRLVRRRDIAIETIRGADHIFSHSLPRQKLLDLLCRIFGDKPNSP